MVSTCVACATNRCSPTSVDISSLPRSREPLSRLHIDLGGPFLGKMFIVAVDSHSKWLEVKLLKSTNSGAVIEKLDTI